MNRRDFTRNSALLATAAPFPATIFGQGGGVTPPLKTGFAVVGLGVIAKAFMEQIASSTTCEVRAFVSGHPEKAREWAARYNVSPAAIYSYEQVAEGLARNSSVQAVYIATPNGLHVRDTLAAAKAGKHVLCEKPMAISVADCRTMIDACRVAGVKLMIAYRMQYEPLYLDLKQRIAAGDLGRIAAVEGGFGFSAQPGAWRLTRALGGGGPIVDVGIYPLNAIRFLLGEEPVDVTAQVATMDTVSSRFAEVEQSMAWTMKMASGALAACTTSYGASIPGVLQIHGEKGQLVFRNPFGNGGIEVTGGGSMKDFHRNSTAEPNQLRLEAEALAENIRQNTTPRASGEEGLRDHQIFERLYRAAGVARAA